MKAAVYSCFNVFPVRSPQKFHIQGKISTIPLVFPYFFPFLMTVVTPELMKNFEKCVFLLRIFIFLFW